MVRTLRVAVLLSILGLARTASPCEVISMGRPQTAEDYVRSADVIVRVIAKSYDSIASGSSYGPQGETTPRVAFAVEEVLRGDGVGAELTLSAFLSDRDDFNNGSVPYTLARPASQGRVMPIGTVQEAISPSSPEDTDRTLGEVVGVATDQRAASRGRQYLVDMGPEPIEVGSLTGTAADEWQIVELELRSIAPLRLSGLALGSPLAIRCIT
jgi:hypothetical protein